MREIEILVSVLNTKEDALAVLSALGKKNVKRTIDCYYAHPGIPALKTDGSSHDWLRLRKKGQTAYMTYKKDFFKGPVWSHCEEHETDIGSYDVAQALLLSLGFYEFVTVDCEKHIFLTETYEVAFEDVADLGLFLEIEARNPSGSVEEEKNQLRSFIATLGLRIGEELNAGKPELLLAKRGRM